MEKIITDAEQLSVRSDEIDVRKDSLTVQDIVLKLKNTIRENNLLGLSAPQIGKYKRIFCLSFDGGKDIRSFINPMVTKVEGFELSKETCSSIPGRVFIRPRFNKIDVVYQTPLGKVETKRFLGVAAKQFQHEIDHLDGLLLSDVGLEVEDDFFNATDEERAEVIKRYLESLDIREKEIKKEIAEDKELKEQSDAIDYMAGVASGKIKTEIVTEEIENGELNSTDKEECKQ